MHNTNKWAVSCVVLAMATGVLGCSKEEGEVAAPAKASAAPISTPSVAPATTSAAPIAPPAPSPPAVECPKGSSGDGSFDKPCLATGAERMVEVTWTGKMDDKGPSFRVFNKTDSAVLYGKIAVYFYDKAGKQLELPSAEGSSDKARPFHTCFGNMFGGVMKAKEKFVITFSCVKTAHVPEGTKAIEAEMQTVGFADDTEKRTEYYWRNDDLVPEVRPKGGIKGGKKR